MQGAFETLIWIVCGLAVVIAVVSMFSTGKAWEDYGKGGLVMDRERPGESRSGSAGVTLERDAEIRQMLDARNRRRQRRGEPPLDVEAELTRLTGPQIDPELREEIRTLVIARNHRRARKGQPPLDVEAEIERQIHDLQGL